MCTRSLDRYLTMPPSSISCRPAQSGPRKADEMAELRDLVVDEQEFDKAEMTEGLMRYVRLGSSGQLRPGESWDVLPERSKVLAVLLAFKAAAALGLRADESSSALEVAQASGVAHGTVR